MGCGSLMFALPHFVTDTYLKNDEILSGNNTGAHPDLCSTISGQSSFSSNSNLDQMGKSKALATALHLSNFRSFKFLLIESLRKCQWKLVLISVETEVVV